MMLRIEGGALPDVTGAYLASLPPPHRGILPCISLLHRDYTIR